MVSMEEIIETFKGMPYDFPAVSCLSVIEAICPAADYGDWKSGTEAEALARIMAMPGGNDANYLEAHRAVLEPEFDWNDSPHCSIGAGDIAFFASASGAFAKDRDGSMEMVHWRSDPRFPVAVFADNRGRPWVMQTQYGLKIAHDLTGKLRVFRLRSEGGFS